MRLSPLRESTEGNKPELNDLNILNDADRLNEIELFVLDMDGTYYLSEDIITGSNDFLEKVNETGRKYMFFTNNSSKDKKLYIDKLARMGCTIGPEDIYTSGDITINYLKKYYPDSSVYVMGTPPLVKSFEEAGIRLKQDLKETADIVVVAFDMTLTYEKLEHACTLIRNGAVYIATHPDINCPVTGGFIPDCGAFIAAIDLSTGRSPKILGKPYRETAEMIELVSGIKREKIAFVGDRLYTDVACGVKNGAKGILVLSGETKYEDIEKSDVKPDFVFERLYNIGEMLKYR
ncbi:MAG: HAD-IIA family hydrolase [Lachnospiraceae bacterium]|nr:HAD-IIA family hydrolase [Lachnospiraceae bacterium]